MEKMYIMNMGLSYSFFFLIKPYLVTSIFDKTITNLKVWQTKSCRLLRNFSIRIQNRVDQSVPMLWLVLTKKPLNYGFQGSVLSLNQSITNAIVWRTGETIYAEQSGYFVLAFEHKLSTLISQHIFRNTHSAVDVE